MTTRENCKARCATHVSMDGVCCQCGGQAPHEPKEPKKLRYSFSCCQYDSMTDHEKDMLHQLVNAAEDRMKKGKL